jgi:hypothetical protein
VFLNVVALVAMKLKSVPADDGPFIVTVPAAPSDMNALVAALAVMFATFVEKAVAKLLPPIPPVVDVKLRFVASTAPVMLLLSRLSCDVRLTVPTGVVVLPIVAPTFSPPACAVSSTVELAFVFPASIVAVFRRVVALVATKLKSVPADDGPFIVTVPAAPSDMNALVAAFAVMFATFVANAVARLLPPIPPVVDVKLRFVASTAPVILLLNKLS